MTDISGMWVMLTLDYIIHTLYIRAVSLVLYVSSEGSVSDEAVMLTTTAPSSVQEKALAPTFIKQYFCAA